MPINSIDKILEWVKHYNEKVFVSIEKSRLSNSDYWFYDEIAGEITNTNRSFFSVKGLEVYDSGELVKEQPIIIQDEIGYLGIICKIFSGEPHFLMQVKIEPGNINKIQISPTIQATKSNFTQKHGGKKPAYLDYFVNASYDEIVVDQIQSEQSSRFFGKRNRNIIINPKNDVEVLPTHMWITLPQLKKLMRVNNLINMDTRTVLSCLPVNFILKYYEGQISDKSLVKSMEYESDNISQIYHYINDYKMFNSLTNRFVPLFSLKSWNMKNDEFVCKNDYSFKIIFCDIEIEGREVKRWTQPLFEATGIATFALMTTVDNGVRKFLVKGLSEVGCFDKMELAPTIQREYVNNCPKNFVEDYFDRAVANQKNIKFDTLLSEEGGRFYCEQNRNLIIEVDMKDFENLPDGYFWTDFKTLNTLNQVNNCLNIQLRNLLSVLEW